MRTRERNLQSYGFMPGEGEKLKKYVKKNDFERGLLLQCCESAKPGVAQMLYESLIMGLSYDRISYTEYIPLGRDDFYAYQRKALALFREKLMTENRYPIMDCLEQA